ncbi:MAG: hypothetical protein ACXW11_06430 [Methylotenera sp.]
MPINNLSFEFLIESYKTKSGMNFSLAKTKRNYFRLDTRTVEQDHNYGTRYVSYDGLNINLEIIEGEFYNQFLFDHTRSLNKKTFLIYKNKVLIGVYENYTHYCVDDSYDWIHFFVKKMNCEEIRLTIEHILATQLGSELLSIRDQMIQYMSSKPSTSFTRF